ncbi:MAG: phasin family protein [Gammaproteobacteria bacterium]
MTGTFKDAFDPLLKLNGIHARLGGELGKQSLAAQQDLYQSSVEQAQKLSKAKSMEDIYGVYSQWFGQSIPKLFQNAQQCLETLMESATAYQAWAKDSFAVKQAEKVDFKK